MNAKICSFLLCGLMGISSPVFAAGIPVLDVSNLGQTTVTALENVQQTLKQVEQYALQLKQYENEIKNTLAPSAYVWAQAQKTMNKVQTLQEQLDYYSKMDSSDLEKYLAKFGNVNFYKDSDNFGLQTVTETREAAIDASKKANDGLTQTLAQQHGALQSDAQDLETLQLSAQTAQGRLEAIQYTNQLLAQQSNQLLQLRSALLAQAAAENARQQAETTEAAMRAAADEKIIRGEIIKSSGRKW